ncbi:transposase [Streptomyces yerevanensis]|uniref:transposase n=1 Tax=Streptomyces yerevanensis TaxID=66378 RepID=UPI000D12B980
MAAFIVPGHSNAKSEGINHVIKLVARAAHGFRASAPNAYAASPPGRPRGHLHPA